MVLMTTISTSAASVTVYEIYHMMKYNSTNKNYDYYQIPLYWNNVSGGKCQISVDYNRYLSTTDPQQTAIRGAIANSYMKWNNTGKVSATLSGNANVYFSYPTEVFWKNTVQGGNLVALTVLNDTNGAMIYSSSAAYISTGKIRSAMIYFNSDPNKRVHEEDIDKPGYDFTAMSSVNLNKVVVHEMGHALCLGHPGVYESNSKMGTIFYKEFFQDGSMTSIMHQGVVEGIVSGTPTSYDINCLRIKYQ